MPKYDVDVCLVVSPQLCVSQENPALINYITEFYNSARNYFDLQECVLNQFRVRILTSGANSLSQQTESDSPFYNFPQDQVKLRVWLNNVRSIDEIGRKEDLLDVLRRTLFSNWSESPNYKRFLVIVLNCRNDDIGQGVIAGASQIAKVEEIWDGWNVYGKRLIISSPDIEPWTTIGDNFKQTGFIPIEGWESPIAPESREVHTEMFELMLRRL